MSYVRGWGGQREKADKGFDNHSSAMSTKHYILSLYVFFRIVSIIFSVITQLWRRLLPCEALGVACMLGLWGSGGGTMGDFTLALMVDSIKMVISSTSTVGGRSSCLARGQN